MASSPNLDDLSLSFDQRGFQEAHTVSLHLGGYDVGYTQAWEAFIRVMQALATLRGEFQWGEHWFERRYHSAECQHCGGEFSDYLIDLECSGIE